MKQEALLPTMFRAALRATRFRAPHGAAPRLRPSGFNRAHGEGA